MRALRAAALLVAALAAPPARAEEPVLVPLHSVAAPGATAFTVEQIRALLRLKLEAPLYRQPEAIAASLQQRYLDEGYPAARVAGAFDAATGTLTLSVDEGRIKSVGVRGLEGRAADRALAEANLPSGALLRDSDVEAALLRMEEASDGALGFGDSTIEQDAEGANVVLAPRVEPRINVSPRNSLNRASGRANRVDGFAFPLGAQFTIRDRTSYNHTRVEGVAAYGFSSHDWRWASGINRAFGRGGPFTLGYEYHDITDSDDLFRLVGLEEAKGAGFSFSPSRDFFRRTGHEAYAYMRITPALELGVNYRDDEYRSLPVTTSDTQENPAIDDGISHSFIGTLRFSSSQEALFDSRSTERHSFLQRSTYGLYHNVPRRFRGEVTYEWASKSALGGDFSYVRAIANLRFHRPLGARQAFDTRVLLGVAGEQTPLQKRFALGGVGTLRGYEFKVFQGDSMGLVSAEYGFAPGGFIPKVIAFYDGGKMWRNAPDSAWKSDVGLGLRFPGESRGLFGRVDFARAIFDPDETKIRVSFRVQVPF